PNNCVAVFRFFRIFAAFSLFLALGTSLYAQEKYALVIGNGAYRNLTPLNNPVNDAYDMAVVLRNLGFNVAALINGSRVQMEEAIERFKDRLSVSRNSYGFLFYAGHGVQSGGVNYLIPVDADIRSESYLGDRAVSVQAMLDEINRAGNELNIVVLDACRDNPFGWRRSGRRGLQVVSKQPADSIIVYATSAGSTAADGEGRNGLFTTHLLNNLKKPGLSVRDVFDKTGADVRRASGGAQIPAIYSQFFDAAYLGTRPPAAVPAPQPRPAPTPQPRPAPSPQSVPARNARSYFDSGEQFRSRGDYITAIEEYTAAIQLDPNMANAYASRGNAYWNKGDWDRTIADCTQAIRLNPDYAWAYSLRGDAYRNKGDYERAIADCTQAVRLKPDYVGAYYNRGLAYKNKGDYDRAIADYTQAIRLDPNNADAYYSRGLAYYDKGDWDRAIADYTQTVRLNSDYVSAYNNRGSAYYHKKDYNRATADYEAALRIDPNHLNARNNLEKARKARGY
ncbi:MAG: tetratricopeptide repeat protein, partial [Treponema sp.]|nr:tetratricopeptide repeat protein [Treponema sp.]